MLLIESTVTLCIYQNPALYINLYHVLLVIWIRLKLIFLGVVLQFSFFNEKFLFFFSCPWFGNDLLSVLSVWFVEYFDISLLVISIDFSYISLYQFFTVFLIKIKIINMEQFIVIWFEKNVDFIRLFACEY